MLDRVGQVAEPGCGAFRPQQEWGWARTLGLAGRTSALGPRDNWAVARGS